MILREVLHLHKTTCPTPGAVGCIELEKASYTAIRANCGLHGLVLFDR